MEGETPTAPHPDWSLSQEREFLETLLGQRFNFLLVFFSLVIMAALTAETQAGTTATFALGTVVSLLASFPIARAQLKLDLVLRRLEGNHPARQTDEWAQTDKSTAPPFICILAGGSSRRMIGYWIPLVCWLSLGFGALLSVLGCFGDRG